jgi:DNA-binding transcriptional regulator YiaG
MENLKMHGKEFQKLRKGAFRLTQEKMGAILGVHFTTISDWEREDREIPRCAALLSRLMEDDLALREKVIKMAGV